MEPISGSRTPPGLRELRNKGGKGAVTLSVKYEPPELKVLVNSNSTTGELRNGKYITCESNDPNHLKRKKKKKKFKQ